MKTDYSALDASILEVLAERPFRLSEILAAVRVRNEAVRVARRRAGASPGESADMTVNERLQAMRRNERIAYDLATGRWEEKSSSASMKTNEHVAARRGSDAA